MPTVVRSGDFIERPVTEAKSKNSVRSYEWMPDKDHAELHHEDKRTSKVRVLASTHDRLIKAKKKQRPGTTSSASSRKKLQQHHPSTKVEKSSGRQNEVYIDEEELREIRKRKKAEAQAKEFDRKKELRKKGRGGGRR